MPSLFKTPVSALSGVGPKRAEQFEKLGISSVGELIQFYPRAYEDWSEVTPIADITEEGTYCVKAVVGSAVSNTMLAGGRFICKTTVYDDTGTVKLVFFNNKYISQMLAYGAEYFFYGKITFDSYGSQMVAPAFSPARQGPHIHPVYRSEDIHFPKTTADLEYARRRLVTEELVVLNLGMRSLRDHSRTLSGVKIHEDFSAQFEELLPFELTGAQKRAIADCVNDMLSKPSQMNRLVQGDVGSGKTAVAASVCFTVIKNGFQAAFMAPTEILAAQHYETFQKLLEGTGVTVGLLTGSLRESDKKRVRSGLADGTIQLVIGTHALITDKTEFNNLGLAVTDEQHRFGVAQRAKLLSKGDNPHLLVMSATPIPRTLGLIIFGDLDISVIDELPPNRKPVRTVLLPVSGRGRIYKFIREEVSRGRQAYIVCPLVEEGELEGVASAEEYAAELMLKHFPDIPVGVVHGKLKPAEKDAVMDGFARNEYKILVATTVIEVGVDVPNASVMLIENAERFGLSQLHQLRGRVGRGDAQSFCVMISDRMNQVTRQRLEVMCSTNDGFKIADEDLKMRGPGDFFGERQHGLPQLAIADFADTKSLELSQKIADEIMFRYKDLRSDELRLLNAEIDRLFSRGGHNTMN